MGQDSIYPLMTTDPKIQKETISKIHIANRRFRKTKNLLKSIKIQDDYMSKAQKLWNNGIMGANPSF